MVTKKDSLLLQKEREWDQLSRQYYKRFKEKEDPEVIVDFVRFSLFAFKEDWVIGALMKLMLQSHHHSLQKIFSLKRGGKLSENKLTIRNILITEKIERLVAQGMSKTQAFEYIFTSNNTTVSDWNIDRNQIRKIYYRTKKKQPQIYVCSYRDFFEVIIFPAKIEVMKEGHVRSAYGLLRMFLKSDQEFFQEHLPTEIAALNRPLHDRVTLGFVSVNTPI
jgi:hypothetical protein